MNESVRIGDRAVGSGDPVFVIAEAGVNHNGDPELARALVDAAAAAGADALKIQSFHAERVASSSAPKAEYQSREDGDRTQLEMLKALELSLDEQRGIAAYCHERGIEFLSTPFDEESVGVLEDIGVSAFKVGSGDATNWPLLIRVARTGRPVILSTGMCYLSEVDAALRLLRSEGVEQVVVLHCVTSYPAAPEDANLRAMRTLATALHVPVGYSDHTLGLIVPLAAVAMGAVLVEKHLTLDRSLPGPDHSASLEPDEMKELVSSIRTVERAFGSGVKVPTASEMENRFVVRRSLAAAVDISAGSTLEAPMLTALRPAGGIPANRLHDLLGMRARRDIPTGTFLGWSDVE